MSRRPKPTGLKIVEGNRGHRPLNDKEPKFEHSLPEPPPILDDVGLVEWNRAGAILLRFKVLTEADMAVFAGYCFSYQEWIRLCMIIREKELAAIIQKTPNGLMVESAISTAASKYYKQMIRGAVELGLTPSSRTRISADNTGTLSPFEQDMFGC